MPETNPEATAPRWVRMSSTIAAAVVVLIGVLLAFGHGPGQHFTGGALSSPSNGAQIGHENAEHVR
jgi:hypothetical protein